MRAVSRSRATIFGMLWAFWCAVALLPLVGEATMLDAQLGAARYNAT